MINITALEKRFSNDTLIKYNDIAFEDGKSYILLGASGCGKTTLLNMIAGIITPSGGKIEIDGREMSGLTAKEKDKFRIGHIGYIFQDFKLMEEMSVQDNIDILNIEKIDTSGSDLILDKLGILSKKKKKVKTLSGGEKQRVAIARALVKNPDIILADEPTGNLNYEIGVNVIKALLQCSAGKTLITVAHDTRLAQYFDFSIDVNGLSSVSDLKGGQDNA